VAVAALVLLLRGRTAPVGSVASSGSAAVTDLAWPVPNGSTSAVVEVLNGTGRAGLARTATRLLRSHGIDVVGYGNGDSSGTTRVLLRRGDERRARLVVRALGTGSIVSQPDSTRRVDVTVILGDDFHPEMPLHP